MIANKRLLVITECFQCPEHKISISENRAFCDRTKKEIKIDDIPDWCPLQKVEK